MCVGRKENSLFKWKARIKKEGQQEQINLEPIIWFDFPLAFINDVGNVLLIWYGELEELEGKSYDEYWLLVYNPFVVDLLRNKKTLRSLVLEGETYLVGVNYSEKDFEVIRPLYKEELVNSFILPEEDSYLGDLCSNRLEILEYIESKKLFEAYEVVDSEIVRYTAKAFKPISFIGSMTKEPINAFTVKGFNSLYSYFSFERNINVNIACYKPDTKIEEEVYLIA